MGFGIRGFRISGVQGFGVQGLGVKVECLGHEIRGVGLVASANSYVSCFGFRDFPFKVSRVKG